MAEIDFDTEEEEIEDIDTDDDLDLAPQEGFFTRRRLVILAMVVISIFVITMGVFALRDDSSDVSSPQGINAQNKAGKVPEKRKKRKKKIKYKNLYRQLNNVQLSGVVRELSFKEIAFEIEQNGNNFNISVDQEELENAQRLLAIKGLPAGGIKGFELLDDQETLGVTEFDKRVRFLRALSGEIEKAIIQFDVVEQAKVQIVLPEQRLFSVARPPVTASILVRKAWGMLITDETVFSIIQLVSKAVENLQPENVSVIDTEGRVLSIGIFERIEEQRRLASQVTEEVVEEEAAFNEGVPILPDYKNIGKWYEIKQKYEKDLEDKAIKQLLGVLPIGSFKLAITTDLGAVENGQVLDVKRIGASIVVDNNNDDIFLDSDLKNQIFSSVSGAIGYVRGRDNIQLSKADFLSFTDEEMARFKKLKGETESLPWLGILSSISIVVVLSYLYRRWRKKRAEEAPDLLIDGGNRPGDFDLGLESEQNINRIKDVAKTNPETIAKIMEEWLADTDVEEEVDDLEGEFEEDFDA